MKRFIWLETWVKSCFLSPTPTIACARLFKGQSKTHSKEGNQLLCFPPTLISPNGMSPLSIEVVSHLVVPKLPGLQAAVMMEAALLRGLCANVKHLTKRQYRKDVSPTEKPQSRQSHPRNGGGRGQLILSGWYPFSSVGCLMCHVKNSLEASTAEGFLLVLMRT